MVTDILAIYAAVVSTVSLAISYSAYRSDDPKLSGSAEMVDERSRGESPQLTISISLHNRGRGAITVDSAEIWQHGQIHSWMLSKLDAETFKLPARIEGHSGIRWKFRPADNVPLLDGNKSPKFEARIGLALSAGASATPAGLTARAWPEARPETPRRTLRAGHLRIRRTGKVGHGIVNCG